MVEQTPDELIQVVRLLTADVDTTNPVLTDDQLEGFLTLYTMDPRRAAARALRTVAASEVLVSKKIRTQDLQTDGPAVSAELRVLADSLDAEADALDVAGLDDSAAYWVPHGAATRVEGEESGAWYT